MKKQWRLSMYCYGCGRLQVEVITSDELMKRRDWSCVKCGGPRTMVSNQLEREYDD